MRPTVYSIFTLILMFLCAVPSDASTGNRILIVPEQDTVSAPDSHKVENEHIGIEISDKGEIVATNDKSKGRTYPLREFTAIEGLFSYKTSIDQKNANGISITQTMRDSMGDRACTIEKKIALRDDAVHVEVKVIGDGYAWNAPIATHLKWLVDDYTKFWTAWGKKNNRTVDINLDGDAAGQKDHLDLWEDPFVPSKFDSLRLTYGGKKKEGFVEAFSLPLATILQPDKQRSLNIVFSPKDTIIDMEMKTAANGSLTFSRLYDRISEKNSVSYSYDLFFREADWRPVLGWITEKYPTHFNPPNPRVRDMDGTASYSGYNGKMDVKKYSDMAYAFNWYAVRNWPYLGMFLPPVEEGETWQSWSGFGSGTATTGRTVAFDTIRRNHGKMQQRRFHLLEYFNLNEFGYRIKFPYDSTLMNEKEPLWKISNNLLHQKLKPAMLYTEDNRARLSWNRCVIMDPGHEIYHTYLMGQAERMIMHVPNFSGYGIDRLDWFEHFNYRADDGITMVDGKKASAMATSLHKIMKPLSELLHKNDKVIFYNPHITRLDYAQYFDGIFDEFADKGNKINLSALLAVKKPIVGWIHHQETIEKEPDRWMQKYLYLGVYPMAPYPEANHSLEASEWADRLFLDYGLLFKVLKGKQWVFEPHIASVENEAAKINVFKTDAGYLVPIVHGDKNRRATIRLKWDKLYPDKKFKAYIVHPGDEKWASFRFDKNSEDENIHVELKRGAAVLLFK